MKKKTSFTETKNFIRMITILIRSVIFLCLISLIFSIIEAKLQTKDIYGMLPNFYKLFR